MTAIPNRLHSKPPFVFNPSDDEAANEGHESYTAFFDALRIHSEFGAESSKYTCCNRQYWRISVVAR
ncbi:hypothetical protein Nepgr_000222 [Nepenthes gracilis]|uniref:Uncharacterized protein n=1 Tax=Nepenthes gracilis TaxID=150966 RepID=A0AAD3RWN1_NEPGR|nr:hypothetical protein Nepgr_000222 [Nepenthes gracilis]